MKIGFTGTKEGMTLLQKLEVVKVLQEKNGAEFHHGDCIGADADFHNVVKSIKDSALMHVHPPKNPKLRAFKKADVLYEEKEYLTRNHDIVDACDVMIATPKSNEEELRSGTWATIRYTKKLNKELIIIFPDGSRE